MIGDKGGNAMSEEKRMPVLTGQKKQIFYTGLLYDGGSHRFSYEREKR